MFVIYRRPNLLFIIMNYPLVNIDIDVDLFNNIYPDLNGNQSSEYYDHREDSTIESLLQEIVEE